MNMLNIEDVKWIEDSVEDIKKISQKIELNSQDVVKPVNEDNEAEPKTAFSKMKAFVKKAVDCCIE